MRVQVSSAIDKEDFERWKKTGMRLNHVIKLGLLYSEQTPGYVQRIAELEDGNKKLQQKIQYLAGRIAELEGQT